MRELNIALLRLFYDDADVNAVIGVLTDFIDDNIHKKIAANDVWSYLDRALPRVSRIADISSVPNSEIADQDIRHIFIEDVKKSSSHLSDLMDEKINNIDQNRREGVTGDFLEELENIRHDTLYIESLRTTTLATLLCVLAALHLDTNDNLTEALQLVDEAKVLSPQLERVQRMEAWIKAYKENDLDTALNLIQNTHEISSRNLSAKIMIDKGLLQEAKLVLNTLSEGDAETYRLLTLIAIKNADLSEAKTHLMRANDLQSSWLNIRFATAIVTYLETLTDAAMIDYANSYPFPPPIERMLVKLDKKSIRIYQDAQKLFQNLTEYHSDQVVEAHIWCLASLVYNPATQSQASEYCQQLINVDPTYAPTIMWGIIYRLNIDLIPAESALEQLENTKQIQPNQQLTLAEVYLHLSKLNKAQQYLENIQTDFKDSPFYVQWLVLYSRTLLNLEDITMIQTIIDENQLQTEERFRLHIVIEQHQASKSSNWTRVIDLLRGRYDETLKSLDLLNLCLTLYDRQEWDELEKYGDILLKKIPSSDTNWMVIVAFYHTGKYQQCLELIHNYEEIFEPIVPKSQLLDLQSHCLEEIGDLKKAISLAQRLLSEYPSTSNLHNLAHLYQKIGDFAALETLSGRLFEPSLVDTSACLSFAQFLQHYNHERAIALWRHARSLGIPDSLVSTAYIIAIQLNLYTEAQELGGRFFNLADQNIGGEFISSQDFIDIQKEDHQLWEQANTKYHEGTIGFHFFIEATGVSLILQHSFNFNGDLSNSLGRGNAILARHGSKAIIHPPPGSVEGTTLFADITAILLAHQLSVLNLIETVFKPIHIPQTLIPALGFIQQQLLERANRQPRQILQNVQNLIENKQIEVIDTETIDLPEMRIEVEREITKTQAALLFLARKNEGRYIEFLPLIPISVDLEVVPSNISTEWNTYISNRESVILGLRENITHSQYLESFAKLRNADTSTDSQPIPLGMKLYFGNQIAIDFALLDILPQICQAFQVHVSAEFYRQLQHELVISNNTENMADSLSKLIQHLNTSILNSTYETLPNPSPQQYANDSPVYACLATLIEVPAHDNYAIWIDDRFVNGLRVGNNPSVGINDLLGAMRAINKLSDDDYYSYLIKLRAANIRYIPVEIDELLYHLKSAVYDDKTFTETLDLKILKRYIAACMDEPIDIQHPTYLPEHSINPQGELLFVASLKLSVYKIFPRIWLEFDNPEIRYQVAMWVRNNLLLDYMAIIENYYGLLKDFTKHRLIPDLSAICLQYFQIISDTSYSNEERVVLTDDFIKWMWGNIVHPYVLVEPDLLYSIAERMKAQLIDLYENTNVGESDLLKKELRGVYYHLPDSIRNILMEDDELLSILDIKSGFIIEIQGLVFDAFQFWRVISRVIKGETTTLEALNTPYTFTLQSEATGNHTRINIINPADNQKKVFRIGYAGVLSDTPDEQLNSLKNIQNTLDCSNDEISRLSTKIANTIQPLYRIQAIDYYRQTSVVSYYKELIEKLKNLQQDAPLHFDDLLPPSLLGLVRHFRFSLREYTFPENFLEGTSILLEENSLLVAFQRMSCFPVPLPDKLTQQFLQSDQSTQEQILENMTSTSRQK